MTVVCDTAGYLKTTFDTLDAITVTVVPLTDTAGEASVLVEAKADGTATVTASLSCGAQNLTADTLVTLTECDGGYIPVPTICGIGACASTGTTSCVAGVIEDSCTPGTPGSR